MILRVWKVNQEAVFQLADDAVVVFCLIDAITADEGGIYRTSDRSCWCSCPGRGRSGGWWQASSIGDGIWAALAWDVASGAVGRRFPSTRPAGPSDRPEPGKGRRILAAAPGPGRETAPPRVVHIDVSIGRPRMDTATIATSTRPIWSSRALPYRCRIPDSDDPRRDQYTEQHRHNCFEHNGFTRWTYWPVSTVWV